MIVRYTETKVSSSLGVWMSRSSGESSKKPRPLHASVTSSPHESESQCSRRKRSRSPAP